MAINSDFNYDDILSLEKAKLIDRAFLNSLGSQELILDYNGIASAAREDSVEWLHANRKSIEDPHFGFKTYEGTWFCIDIKYDENNKTIRQRFKIDSSLEDEATKEAPRGTLAEKSYYWRIVDPNSIPMPTPTEGITYTKTMSDNGDGTYDVIVSKDSPIQFDYVDESVKKVPRGTLAEKSHHWSVIDPTDITMPAPAEGTTYTKTTRYNGDESYDIVVNKDTPIQHDYADESVKRVPRGTLSEKTHHWSVIDPTDITMPAAGVIPAGTTYTKTTRYNGDESYDIVVNKETPVEFSFADEVTKRVSAGTISEKSHFWSVIDPDSIVLPVAGSIPDGTTYEKSTRYNGDETYNVVITKDVSVDFGGGGGLAVSGEQGTTGSSPSTSIFVSGSDDPDADQEYTYDGGSGEIGTTAATWTGADRPAWVIEYTTSTTPDGWRIKDTGGSTDAFRGSLNLNSSQWVDYGGSSGTPEGPDRPSRVVQIGANPPAFTEDVVISTNSEELSFIKDGGDVPNPLNGQEKTINNTPLGNGKFQSTITTRTANQQRVPALLDSIVYNSTTDHDKHAIIVGKNASYEQFQRDINGLLEPNKLEKNNSVSVNVNRYGLYDYTIRSVSVF
jgi:hypothetical protein